MLLISRQRKRVDEEKATHSVIVFVKVCCHHWLVPRQRFLQVCKRIAGDTECRCFDVMRKRVKSGLITKLAKNLPRLQRKGATKTTHCSEYRRILHSASCLKISLRIIPVFNATSSFSYPAKAAKIISGFAVRYSTVGDREPICRLKRLLKI